jgi:hypothetical protein
MEPLVSRAHARGHIAAQPGVIEVLGTSSRLPEGARRATSDPGIKAELNKVRSCRVGRVNLVVVWTELMDSIHFNMSPAFTDPAVTTLAFPSLKLVQIAVHPDEKHVEAGK